MFIEVYNEKVDVTTFNYQYIENTILTLDRVEINIMGNYIYIMKSNNKYHYIDFDKYPIIKPIINYYMSQCSTMSHGSNMIDMKFVILAYDRINVTIYLNTDYIKNDDYYKESALIAICYLMVQKKYPSVDVGSLSYMFLESSFIPTNNSNNTMSQGNYDPTHNIFDNNKDFKIKLFDYQKKSILKMIDIENNNIKQTQRTFELEIGDVNLIWDPMNNMIVNKNEYINISTKGGILADSMGLGKTVTMTGLMHFGSKPIVTTFENKIFSKATLVIVPSHLAKQWIDEYVKAIPCKSKKIVCILTKTQHTKTTYKDFREADIIVVTQQFLLNFKNYIAICYKMVTPMSYSFEHRKEHITNVYKEWINTNADIDIMTCPLFEFFHFHRVIVDEGHEIFEKNLGTVALNKWLLSFLMELNSNYRWYVSGTPFRYGLINIFDFIDLKLIKGDVMKETLQIYDIVRNKGVAMMHCDINKSNHTNKHERHYMMHWSHQNYCNGMTNFISSETFMKNLLQNIVIRHQKEDVIDMVKIPGYVEMIEWVELTPSERSIYDSKKLISSKITLQQLCCHPLIVESMKKMVNPNNMVIDLDKVKENLIDFHKTQITDSQTKIIGLDITNKAYHMLLSNYNSKISESNYMLNILEKFDDNIMENKSDITCVICFNDINMEEKTILTSCGHLYCMECIMTSIKYKAECPTCKNKLMNPNNLYLLDNKKNIIPSPKDINPLINKYGAKLGKLIQMVKTLLIQDNHIIIFSQWDDMLTLVGKSLAENGVNNSFIKGNVHCRNKAISQFKNTTNNDDMSRVIMLSLKNSASGTNLTEATHIFFIEPINMTKDECKIIESQAIGRACRLGQKNTVNVIRILCKDTIEESIYNTVYNTVYNTTITNTNTITISNTNTNTISNTISNTNTNTNTISNTNTTSDIVV